MRTSHFAVVAVSLVSLLASAGCNSAATQEDATPTPQKVVSHSREVRKDLNERLENENRVFHAGCRDDEKAACMDTTRVCPDDPGRVEGMILATLKKRKKAVAIEWEEPRVTWEKNEGVDAQYWFVNPDGSGTHFWRVPGPDDLTIDCGNGVYCGWHKADHAAGSLLVDGKLSLVPRDAKEPIADLAHCPEPPPQPDWGY